MSVCNMKSMKKKEMIGWFLLGLIGVMSMYKSVNKILDGLHWVCKIWVISVCNMESMKKK